MAKKAYAHWMGGTVAVRVETGKRHSLDDKVLKTFKAGSRGMCESMARWAARNNVTVVNLKRDRRTGRLKVMM